MAVRRRVATATPEPSSRPASGFGWRLISMIISDDLRREDNGKEIIIGVYTDDIIAARFPATLLSLMFRVAVHLERKDFKAIRILVKNPDGSTMLDISQPILSQPTTYSSIFGFGLATPTFAAPGLYEIHFAVDDAMQLIGTLRLRPPETDEEFRRAGTGSAKTA